MPGAYLWGWDGAAHRQVLTDLAGHLQVDVVTTPFPVGFATSANQVITHGYIDGLEGLLGGGLPAALVAGSLSVINNVASEQHCYGWDGGNWQQLLVESAAQKNLRVKLYDGANGIDSDLLTYFSFTMTAKRALYTRSQLLLVNSSTSCIPWRSAIYVADGESGHYFPGVGLWGYNGATWDRLRTEDAGSHNLRVKLYDGAQGLDFYLASNNLWNQRLLPVVSVIHGQDGGFATAAIRCATPSTDNLPANQKHLQTLSTLYGFNGAQWSRLRTKGTGVLSVGKGNIGATPVRVTAIGSVAAGARLLHQICVNPSAGNAVLEITDAIIAAQPLAWDMFFTNRETHHYVFDPPIPFTTGIYIETLTNITSVMLCYE